MKSLLKIDGLSLSIAKSLLASVHRLDALFLPPLKGRFAFAQAAACILLQGCHLAGQASMRRANHSPTWHDGHTYSQRSLLGEHEILLTGSQGWDFHALPTQDILVEVQDESMLA